MRIFFIFIIIAIFNCITVDEQGRIIEGPEFLIQKDKSPKKWKLNEIPNGPRWTERDNKIPLLIIPRNENLKDNYKIINIPPIMNQGRLASSSAFAAGYLAMSYYTQNRKNIKNYICSPSFIYNLLNNEKNEGIDLADALELLRQTGCPPIETFPYNEIDYKLKPPSPIIELAMNYKIEKYYRIDPTDFYQIASFISQNSIVIATIHISENFLKIDKKTFYEPEGNFIGKHSIGIVGFNALKQQLLTFNSFGDSWGDKGFVWIPHEWFKRLVICAYVIGN